MKTLSAERRYFNVKPGGTYSYQQALNRKFQGSTQKPPNV